MLYVSMYLVHTAHRTYKQPLEWRRYGSCWTSEGGGSVREKKIGSVVEEAQRLFFVSPLGAFLFSLPEHVATPRDWADRAAHGPAHCPAIGRVRLNAIFEISAAHATNASASTKRSLRKYLGVRVVLAGPVAHDQLLLCGQPQP